MFNSFMKSRNIFGKTVALVPYREKHVFKYNQWMKDPNLQYLTGSEPLSLEEELQMMSSWTSDPNKCTFILCDKQLLQSTDSEIESMIGDINLFYDTSEVETQTAEIEIMIAEESHRGLGKGKEAVLLMLRFAVEVIGVQRFVAKIKYNNNSSQNLFTRLGFKEQSRSDVFQEVTYDSVVNDNWFQYIVNNTKDYKFVLI